MKRRLLAIYSTCGIGGGDGPRVPWYVDCVRSLLFQTLLDKMGTNFQIAVSSCQNTDGVQHAFRKTFGDNVTYNFVEESYPLSVTFNDTVQKCVNHFGPFDGYLYIDSGITFWDPSTRFDAVETLWNAHTESDNCITAAFPSNDDGSSWWNIRYEEGKDHEFALGSCTNMHCQIFSEDWRRAYGHVLPDTMASNCMESLFSLMARAIHKRYVVTQKVHVQHLHSLDGASMFARAPNPDFHPISPYFKVPGQFFKRTKSIDETYRKGHALGFGFEQYQEWWKSDPNCFDEKGYAKNPKLRDFIKEEMYLSVELFDYSKIKARFIPAKR